jgi:hypothetical protein
VATRSAAQWLKIVADDGGMKMPPLLGQEKTRKVCG